MAAKSLEEIAKDIKKMKFKSSMVGGVDKQDVWKKIEKLNQSYMDYIEEQRISYEALIADRDRQIAQLAGGVLPASMQGMGAPQPGAAGFDQRMVGIAYDPEREAVPQGFDPAPAPLQTDAEAVQVTQPGFDPVQTQPPSSPAFDVQGRPVGIPQPLYGQPVPEYDPSMPPPAAFDPAMMPPGFDPAMMQMAPPPGFDPAAMQMAPPPGFDPSMMTPPPGFDPAAMQMTPPPGFDPAAMQMTPPPGFDPSQMAPLPGFDPAAVQGMPQKADTPWAPLPAEEAQPHAFVPPFGA